MGRDMRRSGKLTIQYVNMHVVEHGRMFKIQYYGNKIVLIQDILEHTKVLFGKTNARFYNKELQITLWCSG